MAHRHVYPTVSVASMFGGLLAWLGRDEVSRSEAKNMMSIYISYEDGAVDNVYR